MLSPILKIDQKLLLYKSDIYQLIFDCIKLTKPLPLIVRSYFIASYPVSIFTDKFYEKIINYNSGCTIDNYFIACYPRKDIDNYIKGL